MKETKILKKMSFLFFLIFLSNFSISKSGIIEPDDILPLEISPSYQSEKQFIFRFYIPNSFDKNDMPTIKGYGAGNEQYIGIRFNNIDPFNSNLEYTCSLLQIDNNIKINLEPLSDYSDRTIFCQIQSNDNSTILLPGYNYKLTINFTTTTTISLQNLISISIFTSNIISDEEIIDIGTFNHINIYPNYDSQSIVTLTHEINPITIKVKTSLEFKVNMEFTEWFSWDDYIIVIGIPKNLINSIDPTLITSSIGSSTNRINNLNIKRLNLEENTQKKFYGFYIDGEYMNYKGENLQLTFSGFETSETGLISGNLVNKIDVQIRYRNSYVICSSIELDLYVTLGNINFSVKHPETDTEIFDVFQGGAFQIEFNINAESDIEKKYILIKQKSDNNAKVTFIASSCDFSSFDIDSQNFDNVPKCYPLKYKNDESNDVNSGIFFYYPYKMKANQNYKFRVWIFFDQCGELDNEYLYDDTKNQKEIFFYLEIYNNIDKDKIGTDRINSNYVFVNNILTNNGIVCYSTYMGKKNYNGYFFQYDDYLNSLTESVSSSSIPTNTKEKLFYREYFDWNIFDYDGDYATNSILNNLFDNTVDPKFIYSSTNKLSEGNKLLLVNKLIIQSGNNEKLSQFYPMGFSSTNLNQALVAIRGNFFIKLSKNFFATKTDETCHVAWSFGSPSISDTLSWKPEPKFYRPQKYNFITNSDDFFSNPAALYNPYIDTITNNSLISKENVQWTYSTINGRYTKYTNAEWGFGDDETLKSQISDNLPVEIYFGLADSCHYWTNLDQTITSLYTPIEIILGIKKNKYYVRVLRFIKLFPEGGVWHDNKNTNNFIKSNQFIIKNHFAFNNNKYNNEQKGVCLLEILPGIIDSQRGLSSNFFLWIFLGSLLETDYETISNNYPIGNLAKNTKIYSYTNQHSIYPNNFYGSSDSTQNSDITSPLYTLAMSMNSIYQSANSGYLFYLGSLLIFNNNIKSDSFYNSANDPLLIPYYCPYYQSESTLIPYSLGIFPSFIGGFGTFDSVTNLGNKGLDKFLVKEINTNQVNLLMLSDVKIVLKGYNSVNNNFINSVKFIHDYVNNKYTLNVFNENDSLDYYDSIDAFMFLLGNKIDGLTDNLNPEPIEPSSLYSLTKYINKNNYFYVYGKKFYSGIFGIMNKKLFIRESPYLSINIKFDISTDNQLCESENKFCPDNLISFYGLSSNHDINHYISNYNSNSDSFLIDNYQYSTYINNNPPTVVLSSMEIINDNAISLLLTFNSPFTTAIIENTILSFKIVSITDEICSVQNSNSDYPSTTCENSSGEIKCQLKFPAMTYNIYCYKLKYNSTYSFENFKLYLPFADNTYDTILNNVIFKDSNTYIYDITNSIQQSIDPTIEALYITQPYNLGSLSKLEIKVDLNRKAHPGMILKIEFDTNNVPLFIQSFAECKFSLSKLNTYSMDNINIDDFLTEGNNVIKNCEVTFGTSNVIVTATFDDKIYKAGKDLSSNVYIYLWPVKTLILENKSVDLSLTVNSLSLINSNNPTTVSFMNNDQNIETAINPIYDSSNEILSITSISSNIKGDLSDYTINFRFNTNNNINNLLNSNKINIAQIFWPKEVLFQCEECVKCYDGTTMINCYFVDNNILNIFFPDTIKNDADKEIIITGIINPTSLTSLTVYVNLIKIDDAKSVKYTIMSGKGTLPTSISYIPNAVKTGGLRFYYMTDAISDKNPRIKSNYYFKFGFDYANNYNDYSTTFLSAGSFIYIDFPRDYHLYINENPNVILSEYYSDENSIPVNGGTVLTNSQILGHRLKITLNEQTPDLLLTTKFKYWLLSIITIKNPNNINQNLHTGYFKITCYNNPSADSYYYTTGINSNTYRQELLDDNTNSNEYNWYRSNLIKPSNTSKYVLDILYNSKTYDFIFLQPGRYQKMEFLTTSLNTNNEKYLYISPSYIILNFPSNSVIQTLQNSYTIPSLYGELYSFYMGVSCSVSEGIYVVTPNIIDNDNSYIEAPNIIINVRQIETAKIEIADDPGFSPLLAKTRIYYYLDYINVDELTVGWDYGFTPTNINIEIEKINIPKKTYTNKSKKISNIFNTFNIISGSQESYTFTSSIINNCYEMSPSEIIIKQSSQTNFATIKQFVFSNRDITINNMDSDSSLSSNEIKFVLTPPHFYPSFIMCELYCKFLSPDDGENLVYPNFDRINNYVSNVGENYFRQYTNNYFKETDSVGYLIFHDLIKGYEYNIECAYQSTQSDSSLVTYSSSIMKDDSRIKSSYPTNTRCNTFYYENVLSYENKQKYINYCQYIFGKNMGYDGCIICTDISGKIIAPGYELNTFSCSKEKCFVKSTNELLEDIYSLNENIQVNEKYEFTICATSNRICETQISENDFNKYFNEFINNINTTEKVNTLFDDNTIKYNGLYQNKIYKEDQLIENNIKVNIINDLSNDGSCEWEAFYTSQVTYNILCYWKIKANEIQPNLDEMINCQKDENYCGVFLANYEGCYYKIPDSKKTELVEGEYFLYVTCSHLMPSPIYFTSIKNVYTINVEESSSFAWWLKKINFEILLILLCLCLL